ncbi:MULTISPECIES: hypothetical protein [Rhizobium/Agrobacterium group]|uniref:hypothetical protein n=1 Tax=Rhizobium/Agrobacterium group TaxID=227290 RepID=UPI0018D23C55|nr:MULTISPECIES: hypothetical protein [Rhizobium/Agrobacterium group]
MIKMKPAAIVTMEEKFWCCYINFVMPAKPLALGFSGGASRAIPGIEGFEAMVANCLCGSAAGWN